MTLLQNKKLQYFVFGLFCFFSSCSIVEFSEFYPTAQIFKAARYIIYFCMAVIFVFCFVKKEQLYSLRAIVSYAKKHLVLLIFGLLSLAATITSKDMSYVIFFLMLCYVSLLNFKKALLCFFCSSILCFLMAVILVNTPLVDSCVLVRVKHGEVTFRYALGFMHCLETQAFLFFILASGFYLLKRANKRLFAAYALAALILDGVVYYFTDSRTSLILIVLLVIGAMLIRFFLDQKKMPFWFKALVFGLVILMIVSMVMICLFYQKGGLIEWIDTHVLSFRFSLANEAIQKEGIHLFGKSIDWVGQAGLYGYMITKEEYYFVDCAYIKLLLDAGVLYYLAILTGYLMVLAHKLKNSNWMSGWLLVLMFVCCLMESRLIQSAINPFTYLLAGVLMKENRQFIKAFSLKS
jgi:hypothetical protein